MTRAVLALSLAALLVFAMGLGWLLGWLWRRARLRGGETDATATLAARLHAAETARDAAEARLAERSAALEAALAAAEAEHVRALAALRAELDATVSALGDARRDAGAWREAYEGLLREDREDP